MSEHLKCPFCTGPLTVVEAASIESDGDYWVRIWLECPICPEILDMSVSMPPEDAERFVSDPTVPRADLRKVNR